MVKLTVRACTRFGAWALFALCCAACKEPPPPEYGGMDALSGQSIRVRPGPLPAGASWTGCYASPQIGRLTLEAEAPGSLIGRYAYERGACEVTGELHGTLDGNLARFEFWERTERCPSWRPRHGRGHFLYSPPPVPNQPVQLLGEQAFLRARRVSRDYAVLEPYGEHRVTALRREHCGDPQPNAVTGAQP